MSPLDCPTSRKEWWGFFYVSNLYLVLDEPLDPLDPPAPAPVLPAAPDAPLLPLLLPVLVFVSCAIFKWLSMAGCSFAAIAFRSLSFALVCMSRTSLLVFLWSLTPPWEM